MAAALSLIGCSLSYNLHDRYTFDLVDGGMDAGVDGGPVDAGPDGGSGDDAGPVDAGPVPGPTVALYPWNGFTTGSALVSRGAALAEHPLKPKLMWHPTDGAHHYQVQMESECPIESFRSCTFPAPALDETTTETTFHPSDFLPVSMTPPVGRRYVWRVRACNAADECGAWSEPRYLDVGRQPTDYNGDGYADVAVGAPYLSSPGEYQDGYVFIFYGSSASIPTTPSQTLLNPERQSEGHFGLATASGGDLNGDGFADLLIGAPDQDLTDVDQGNAYIYFGSISGISATPNVSIDNPMTSRDGGRFGAALSSTGDLNGDGYLDLAIGAPNQDNPFNMEGETHVFYGSSIGIRENPDLDIGLSFNQQNANFGSSISHAGDTNGDGLSDIIVSSPRSDYAGTQGVGRFHFYNGRTGRLPMGGDVTVWSPTEQFRGYFSATLSSLGDIDGDGYGDFAIGSSSQDIDYSDEGHVFLYHGSSSPEYHTPSNTLRSNSHEAYERFGSSITNAGDFDGDGLTDFAICSSRSGDGSIYLYLGRHMEPIEASGLEITRPTGSPSSAFPGIVVGVGDLNADGYSDLVVGASSWSNPETNEGNIFIYHGRPSLDARPPELVIDNPFDRTYSTFGWSIAGF